MSFSRGALILLLPLGLACAGVPDGPPDALVAQARDHHAKRDYNEAKRYASAVTKKHAESEEAEEALYLLADSQRHIGHGQRAFENYTKFVKTYPNSRFGLGVADGEYELGVAYLEGRMTGFLFFGADRSYGVRVLDHMQVHFGNNSRADDALMRVADYFLDDEAYGDAADTLKRLLAEYPRSEHVLRARFQFARSLWLQNQGPLYDERLLLQSRRGFEDYVGTARLLGEAEKQQAQIAAAEEMVGKINERLAEKEYLIARFYQRTKAPRSALYYYRHCVRTYPDTKYAAECRKRIPEAEKEAAPAEPLAAKPPAGA
jgi:outer membrane protein assembly factor BamD (BamD/ComL family)